MDSLGFYIKTIRLRVGEAHNYKFHEHLNAEGSSYAWYTDPLNPLINYSDNNNSILNVTKVMIFEMLPKNGNAFVESPQHIVAGVFSRENDPILLDQSTIYLDGSLLTILEGNVIPNLSILSCQLPVLSNGEHKIVITLKTQAGELKKDSTQIQVIAPVIQPMPAGIVDGINFIDDSTITLSLYALHKKFVHVLGDFNSWGVDPDFMMKQTPDQNRFWLSITGLQSQKEYIYQYLIDGEKRIADPCTDKISDPWNDQYISPATYPNPIPYPTGKTTDIAPH